MPMDDVGRMAGAADELICLATPAPLHGIGAFYDNFSVVSRGGRPDLAGRHLAAVRASTLLIVGSLDADVLDLNRQTLFATALPLPPHADTPGDSPVRRTRRAEGCGRRGSVMVPGPDAHRLKR